MTYEQYHQGAKQLFTKYQHLLLSFVESGVGKDLFGIRQEMKVAAILPNGFLEYLGKLDKNTYILRGHFWTRDYNAYFLKDSLQYLERIAQRNVYDRRFAQDFVYNRLYLRQMLRFLSFSGTSNAGGDGNVFNDNQTDWTTVHGLSSGTAQAGGDPVNVYSGDFSASTRSISRIFVPFDTSSIGSGAKVTTSTATLAMVCTSIPGSNPTIHVNQTTEASPTSLANGDFGNVNSVDGGSLVLSATGAKTFSLNSTAEGWISKTSYTKLGLREDHDLTNSDPGNGSDFRAGFNMADNGTAGNRPTLAFTYTIVGGMIGFEI